MGQSNAKALASWITCRRRARSNVRTERAGNEGNRHAAYRALESVLLMRVTVASHRRFSLAG